MSKDNRVYRHERTMALAKARLSPDTSVGEIAELVAARETIETETFANEADVNSSAYLNYRYMSAYERTDYFAERYQFWYAYHQEHSKWRIGRRHTKHALTAWSRREVAAFWRARQHADAMGIPYDRYFTGAFNYANEKGWSKIPAPNQLYAPEIVGGVLEYWSTIQKDRRVELLPRDCDPRFFAENYVGDKVQIEALDAIQRDVESRGIAFSAGLLSRYMREEKVISEAEARARLGDVLVDEALDERLRNAPRTDHALQQLTPSNPGCFGLYEVKPRPLCLQCPVAMACQDRVQAVEEAMVEKFGSTDPRATHERELARIRKERQRSLDRSGATMTLQEQKRLLLWSGTRKGPKPIPKVRKPKAAPKKGDRLNMGPDLEPEPGHSG